MRPVADPGVEFLIFCEPHGKPVEAFLILCHMKGQLHVQNSSPDTFQPCDAGDFLPAVFDERTAMVFQFAQRPLPKTAVPDGEFSGNAHLAGPGITLFTNRDRVPVLEPADHHAASVRHQHRLRCIKVDAVIDGLIMLFVKTACCLIVISDQAQSPVAVVILKSLRQHILRTGEQYPASVQEKEVRAFPHPAEPAVVLCQLPLIGPVQAVCTGIRQYLAAPVFRTVCDQRQITPV